MSAKARDKLTKISKKSTIRQANFRCIHVSDNLKNCDLLIDRIFQSLLIVSMAGFSWLAMMIVHELGHVFNAWLSGGIVSKIVLHPLAFSRTDLSVNPHPLFVAWGGAIWGCLIPLALLASVHYIARTYKYLFAWWAGFCCVANGAYLACGWLFSGGGNAADDANVILHNGSARWHLIVFGLVAAPLGLWLWNGLGQYFGLGAARGKVDRKVAMALAVALLVLIAGELIIARLCG
jgi:hypothetical protein